MDVCIPKRVFAAWVSPKRTECARSRVCGVIRTNSLSVVDGSDSISLHFLSLRVLVNCLSITALSGRHVVYGFMSQLTEWTQGEHEFVFLHYRSHPIPDELNRPNVSTVEVDDRYLNWAIRTAWESVELPRLVRRLGINIVFCPSGATSPSVKVPQVVLAQNPWCFVRQVHNGRLERLKALLQRRAYRRSFGSADLMIYISDFLRSLYRESAAGIPEGRSEIAHVALDDATHESAARLRGEIAKVPNLIVSVSAMARWKGAHTLVSALSRVRNDGVDAKLRLVGPWPESAYEHEIREQIQRLRLSDAVTITGKVTKEELHRHYAEARVFALMSECESFGIPAAEAQAFGTPAIVSNNCAMPEVCGDGGVYGDADDCEWAAAAISRLIVDNDAWQASSAAATSNSMKYTWQRCSKPLMSMFAVS